MRKALVVATLILSLLVCGPAFAQVNAVLSGTVSDASGALIPGVEVTAKNINTGIADTRLTNESGAFVFPSLQPGSYTLSAALPGFQNAAYNNVVLGQGQQVRLNFTLQVAPAAAQVQMRTRAGTNDIHGAVFYSNNNSFLNSQTYFQNLQHAAKNYANRNQYGARVGGPIIKNKMFFFVLTDDQRYMGKLTQNTLVLTDLAKQGIFRYSTDHRNGAANSTTPSVDANGNVLNPANVRSFNLFSDVKDPHRTAIDPTFMAKYYLPNLPSPNNYQLGDGLN